jgi:hypothetical protein
MSSSRVSALWPGWGRVLAGGWSMADRRRGPGLRPPPAREDCLRLRRGLLARSPGSAGSAGRQQAHSWPRLRARLRRRIIRVGRRSSLSRTASSRGRGRGPFPRSALVDLPDRCCDLIQSEHGTDRWVDRAGLHERHEVAPLPDRVARFDRSVSSDRFPNPPGGFHRNGLSVGPRWGRRGALRGGWPGGRDGCAPVAEAAGADRGGVEQYPVVAGRP